ncbi:hypothetical protein GYMLUDRAFT_238880 [Collybiopsis luxurians FD-317 M1]|nr:hypothetical protein GYMLUDRAFT_238880 [Collybiopsis luxurians FD-317 M1]
MLFTVQSTFGPILIGVFFNAILCGALIVQNSNSYNEKRSSVDEIPEIVDSGVVFTIAWEPLIENYGSPTILEKIPRTFGAEPLVTCIISTLVQVFQGWRIRNLNKSNLAFALIVLIACASLAGGIMTTTLILLHPLFIQLDGFAYTFWVWLVPSAVCDVAISISLSWFVIRNKSSFAPTNSILHRMMLLTLQTGAITAIAAVTNLLTFTLSENKSLQLIWAYSASKLYSNSLLSMLNARVEWNKHLKGPVEESQEMNVSFFRMGTDVHSEPDTPKQVLSGGPIVYRSF